MRDWSNRAGLLSTTRLHGLHALVLAASLALTGLAWQHAAGRARQNAAADFARESERVVALVAERVERQRQRLEAGAALIEARGGRIPQDAWAAFVASPVFAGSPALTDVGLAYDRTPGELLAERAEDAPPLLWAAFEPGDRGRGPRRGGLVHASLAIEPLLTGALDASRRRVALRIADGERTLLDERRAGPAGLDPEPLFTRSAPLPLSGRDARIEVHAGPAFRAAAGGPTAWAVAAAGGAITALLFACFVLLVRANRRALQFTAAASRDLHEKNRALVAAREDALAASRAKDEFLANMSHELRTPLNSVIGLTNAMLDGTLDGTQRAHAEIVLDASESLLHIIEDVLDFAKIQAGMMTFDRTPFDLHRTVSDVVRALGLRAREKGVALVSSFDPRVARARVGDPKRLRQVLLNLIGNAIKFTDAGEVVVSVEAASDEKREGVRFSVRDTGVGIDPSEHDRVFRVFEQADSSAARRHGGTGLGLPICQRMVEHMNGELTLESALGEGSTFTFTAELDLFLGDLAALRAAAEPMLDAPVLPERILLVEDSPTNQKVACAILGPSFDVTVAHHGRHALEILAEDDFDLILMDVQMPEMDGIETTAAIRTRESSEGRHTPIVAMTAHALRRDRERCLEAGMDGYVAKPVRRDALLRAMSEAMASAKDGEGQLAPASAQG